METEISAAVWAHVAWEGLYIYVVENMEPIVNSCTTAQFPVWPPLVYYNVTEMISDCNK